MMLTLFIALAVTLPVGALGLAAGWLGERLGADAKLRAALWTTAFFATTGSALAVLLLDPLTAGFSSSMTFQAADPAVLENNVETFRETYAGGAAQIVYTIEDSPRTLPIGAGLLAAVALGALIGAVVYILRLARLFRLAAESAQLDEPGVAALCQVDPAMVRTADCAAPVLAGFRRPLILLPKALAKLSREQLAMICRHELSHFRRGDNIRSLVENVMGLPFWFNPALALIRRRLIAVREELADADVTARAQPAERRAYAETLLAALRHCGSTAMANAFTGAEARRRIQAIMRPPAKARAPIAAATVLLSILLAAAAATSAVAAASQPQLLIAPRIIAELTAVSDRLGSARETALAQVAERRSSPAPLDTALQAAGGSPAPIEYAKPPPTSPSELPVLLDCTLSKEGRAVDCKPVNADFDPERTRQAIAVAQARTFEIRPESRTISPTGGLQVGPGLEPGPVRVRIDAQGRVAAWSRNTAPVFKMPPDMEFELLSRMKARMAEARQPAVLRDERGRTVGEFREVAQGKMGHVLKGAVTLRLDGRAVGELESDANGGLWFSGRRTVDRGTVIPVRDKDNVLRARRDLRSVQEGDRVLFPFTPILKEEPLPAPTADATAFAESAMKLTRYFKMRPQAEASPSQRPRVICPAEPAACEQGAVYDLSFDVSLDGSPWRSFSLRLAEGERRAVKAPAGFEPLELTVTPTGGSEGSILLDLRILENGEVLAQPKLAVIPDKPGQLWVGEEWGKSFRMQITARPAAAPARRVPAGFRLE